MSLLKRFIRSAIRNTGHQIQKYPSSAFSSVPVFDLSIQLLMAKQGECVTFIQVGANDGRYGDPLYKYIMKYPWHGVLVEPQPDVFAKLRDNYADVKDRLKFENVAIAKDFASIEMYKAGRENLTHSTSAAYAASIVSTNPRVVARQLGITHNKLESFTVPCITLDKLIAKHHIANIDVLQIDTEGRDFEVLTTLTLSEIRPLIIQFEHGHLSPREINGAVTYLSSYGYRILYGGHQNDTLALDKSFAL